MSREREWKLYFDDLVTFCEKVISYTDGLTKEKFEASRLNYDATLWNVQLYGEAAKNIPESIRNQMPEIPWRELIGMRNRLAHGYFGINNINPMASSQRRNAQAARCIAAYSG